MENETARMKANLRRAYELGRLRMALRPALLVIPMVALSLAFCHHAALTMAVGLGLFALAVAFGWRGRTDARAVLPGLLAGTVPLVLPMLLRGSGHCCVNGACWSMCMVGCVAGGLAAGIAVGLAAAIHATERWTFLVAATAVAGTAGILGCATAGTAGIAGMVLAVVATSLPVALVARARV